MRRASHAHRPAFTLVELLMVVTIIGILIGLLLPAVYYGMQSIKKGAIGIELQTLASSVEQYKNKHGSYPPDGSSFRDFELHYKGIFRQMAASEFVAVAAACDPSNGAPGGYMDPPEALVFALGGFSTDPLHPFTGPGGPIQAVSSGGYNGYQYNTDRNEPIYEFKDAQLSIDTSSGAALSTEESEFGLGTNDAMPVYRAPWGKRAPFVYFEQKSYSFAAGTGWFFNNYSIGGAHGYARPYKTDKLNTNVAATPANAERYFKYANDRSFQLISAGLDDNFGGLAMASGSSGPVLFKYPVGEDIDYTSWNPSSTAPTVGNRSRYDDGDPTHPQFDNVANFADGTFENGLNN